MNKGQLRAHFKALLNRSDCEDALADTFIDQSITRVQRTLRIPPMEKTQTYTIAGTTSYLMLPSDFLEVIDLYHDNTNLERVPLSKLIEFSEPEESGTPKYFCREGEQLLIYPRPSSGSVKMNYYGQFPDLTDDASSNDLTTLASDLVTYGALSYAADYYLDERGQLFEGRFAQFMFELQDQANEAELAGTVQRMQPTATYTE